MEEGLSNVAYFRTDGGSSKLYTQEYVDKKDKEIERLNNDLGDMTKLFAKEREETNRLNNIINGMEKFFQYAYDNEVRPLNDRKVSVWTICLDKLQELKGSDRG